MAQFPRRLARLAGVLAGLFLIGVSLFHLPSVRGRVLDRARGYAERELGVALRASSLGFNLFSRSIELRDVSIASASADQPFLEADRAVVRLRPAIFRGRVDVERISLVRPRVTLVRYANGTLNLPPSRQGEQPSAPLRVGIVSVTALSVRLDDRATQRTFMVGPLDLTVDTAGASSPPGAFGPGAFSVRAGDIETSGTLAGRLAFDGARLRIDTLTAETKEGRVDVAGWMDVIGERPGVSAKIGARIDVMQTARAARVDARNMAGHLESTIDVAGDLAAPSVMLAIASRDLTWAPLGTIRLGGRSSLDGTRVAIETLDIESAVFSLQVQGAIELDDAARAGAQASRLAMRWTNVRLDDLARALGSSLAVQSGSIANGSGTVDFAVRDVQARAWSRLRAAASTALQPAANASNQQSLGLSGAADLQLVDGRWSVRHSLHMRNTQVELTGSLMGRVQDGADTVQSTLGGRTHLRIADLGVVPSLLRMADVTVPPGATEGLAGSMAATVDVAGTTGRPLANIDLETRDLRARGLPQPAALMAQLIVDAKGVRAQHLTATAATTSVLASGQYSWRGPFDAHVEATEANLSDVGARSSLPVPVGGSARLEGTISGTMTGAARSGKGVWALSARDLAVDGVAIGPLTATGTLSLADADVLMVNATAPDAGARAQLEIVNRAGYPVSGEITLDHDAIGALIPARYRQQIGDVSGKVSATARGSGSLVDPAGIRGRIDLRALDLTVRGTPLRLAAPGSITVADDRIAVDSVDFQLGQRIRATVGGQLGETVLQNPLRLHVSGPLSDLVDVGSRAAGAEPVPVRGDGTATLDLTVNGTLGHPLPSGTLAVQSSTLQYNTLEPVTDLTLDALIDPSLITLRTGAAGWQGASLRGQGTLPWRVILASAQSSARDTLQSSRVAGWLNALPSDPATARMTVRVEHVTEAMLKGVVPPDRLDQMQANASATVEVETDRLWLDRVGATLVIDRGSVTLAGVPFTQSAPTRVRLAKGRASIESFRWSAEGNSIVATGGADVAAAQPSMNLGVSGDLDLRVLGAFVSGIASGGTAHADLTLTGSFDNPDIVGRITVADGELQVDSPRLAASDLAGTLQLAGGRKVTVSMSGFVNTGNATVAGTLDLANLSTPLGKLRFTGRGVALEYPADFQTESNVDLELALGGTSSTLSGRIEVLSGTYREPLVLTTQLLSASATNGLARAAPAAEWLSRIRLNVNVATVSDVHIDNNYGRFDIGAALRLVGTAATPGVLGRLQGADGGEIYLGGNTYRIERLTIDLTNPRAIAPEVNFAAQTRIGDLPIGVELRCPAAGPCERKVSSLATGVDDAEAEARLFGTSGGAVSAGEGLARLVSGELLGVVGRTVGLDAVRLEQAADRRDIFDDPTLIAGDVDPAARLTLAKRLGSNVELIFSQNLADDGFTWITSYTGPFGLSWRVLVLDDQSRSYEFRHEPPLGGRARPRTPARGPRIDAVRIAGDAGFPEKDVRRQLRLTEGDRFTFGAWQRDRDRLERFYHSREFLEARIRARRVSVERAAGPDANTSDTSADDKVVLEYTITRGPTTRLVTTGVTLPDAVRDRVTERWSSALFDGFLERDARTIVREHLYREGYFSATVTAAIALDTSRALKTLTIDVVPGPIVLSRIDMTGNAALPTGQLLDLVRAEDALAAWLDPASVERLLENHYRSEGFLASEVTVRQPEIRDGVSVVAIAVIEGPAYVIRELSVSQLPELAEQDVRAELALSSGDRYRPAGVAEAITRLETRLRRAAYRQASAEAEARVDAKTAQVDVAVRVTPGPRSILRDVVVQGADPKKPFVARSIVLTPDAPLDPTAIRETRKRLYDLEVYRSVDIEVQPLPVAAPATESTEQPVVARIALEERPRYRFRYGLAVSDEEIGTDERDRRLGFAADFENRNILGRGASAGLSLRLRRDQQVGRVTLGAKRLFGLPIRSTLFVERERELFDPEGAFPITSDITALAAEQAYRVRRPIEVRYGYRVERNHTFIRSEEPNPFDLTVKVARFTTSGLVDRRDDPFNPARGWFASSAFELSTPSLGSDLRFLKNFAQYSHFFPVGPKLVVGSAARFGAARTFEDEVLIPSERFYAGGANSVRGYREDDLGARSILDDAEGGSALLVLNAEVRFPVYRWLRGVGFVDMGNVYPKISDISFGDLQVGVGAGARFDTPFGLIRFDLGIPANRRSFDPRWRIHIGLGHAF